MHTFPLDINSGSIPVWVNMQGPLGTKVLRMAVDTGASLTIIPVETALAIGCDPMMSRHRIEFITPSGMEYAPLITIPVVKAFGFKLKNIEVFCHNLPPGIILT
jgi:predicted aspartyl protease